MEKELARKAKSLMFEEMALRANIKTASFEGMKETFRGALAEVMAERAKLREMGVH